MSYDDWLKKRKIVDSAKRREDERQKEMAKSDPELDRIISDIEPVTTRIYPYLKLAIRNYPHGSAQIGICQYSNASYPYWNVSEGNSP